LGALLDGHTDEVPIRTAHFHSNWELSSQRAINVLGALEAAGVDRARMSARAFADTRPILASDGAIERSASRRVVIRVE
jgi:chemotaxis protein MotB